MSGERDTSDDFWHFAMVGLWIVFNTIASAGLVGFLWRRFYALPDGPGWAGELATVLVIWAISTEGGGDASSGQPGVILDPTKRVALGFLKSCRLAAVTVVVYGLAWASS